MRNAFGRSTGRLFPTLFLAGALVAPLSGCDSGGADDEVTIRGRVSDDASSGAVSGPIEGATVVAAEVGTGGQVQGLTGQATTDAYGEFTLDTEGTTSAVVLTATSGSFTTRALIEAGGAASGTVSAPTMTTETNAEVDVYLAARAISASVTVADVAFFVTRELAGRISGGAESAEDVAIALEAALSAEAAYAAERGAGSSTNVAADARGDAYATYRTAVHAAATTTAGAAARRAFEDAYAGAYADADVRAGAALAASAAAARFSGDLTSSAAFDLNRQARLHAALAGALAVEDLFRDAGGNARLTVLADARDDLALAIGTALTAGAIVDAEEAYRDVVRAELAGETGLSLADIDDGVAATASARAALAISLAAATSADAVAEAVATFHSAARTAVDAALGTSATDFEVDAIVLLALSIAAG